jgi:hypothetical protein
MCEKKEQVNIALVRIFLVSQLRNHRIGKALVEACFLPQLLY